jgi:hypothetical protein
LLRVDDGENACRIQVSGFRVEALRYIVEG